MSHSVILLGNCILEPLKSSRFLSTLEYIDELYELNDELRVGIEFQDIEENGITWKVV